MKKSKDSLVLHLKLDDDIKDGMVIDDRGNQIGHARGDPTFVSDDMFGSCLSFDGIDDYVEIKDDNESLQMKTEFTLEAWVKPSRLDDPMCIMGYTSSKYSLFLQDKGVHGTIDGEKAGTYGTGKVKAGNWHHITMVSQVSHGARVEYYIDGELVGEHDLGGPNEIAYDKDGKLFIGQSDDGQHKFSGLMSNVRVHNQALSLEDIQYSMGEDQVSRAAFRGTHPISFQLFDDDHNKAIYITDDVEGHNLHIEIKNTCPGSIKMGARSGPSSREDHHFELRFRPGTLSEASLKAIRLPENTEGWDMSCPYTNNDRTVSLYLVRTNDLTLEPGEEIALTLEGISADGGEGARGTRVELGYQNLTYKDEDAPIRGYREQHLNIINQLGRKHIPLHVGFVGSNHILNDGTSQNELTLRIADVSRKKDIALNTENSEAPSKFIISFDVEGEKEQKEWALGTSSQVKNICLHFGLIGTVDRVGRVEGVESGTLLNMSSELTEDIPDGTELTIISPNASQDVVVSETSAKGCGQIKITPNTDNDINCYKGAKVYRLDNTYWKVRKETQAQSPQWILTVRDQSQLKKEESIFIEVSNIITGHPFGQTNMYVHYENIPGYWDGQFVCTIERSPLLFSDSNNVGIGTTHPSAPLEVVGGEVPLVRLTRTIGGQNGDQNASIEYKCRDSVMYAGLNTDGNFGIGPDSNLKNAPFVVQNDGKVGIGTLEPKASLEVKAKTKVTGSLWNEAIRLSNEGNSAITYVHKDKDTGKDIDLLFGFHGPYEGEGPYFHFARLDGKDVEKQPSNILRIMAGKDDSDAGEVRVFGDLKVTKDVVIEGSGSVGKLLSDLQKNLIQSGREEIAFGCNDWSEREEAGQFRIDKNSLPSPFRDDRHFSDVSVPYSVRYYIYTHDVTFPKEFVDANVKIVVNDWSCEPSYLRENIVVNGNPVRDLVQKMKRESPGIMVKNLQKYAAKIIKIATPLSERKLLDLLFGHSWDYHPQFSVNVNTKVSKSNFQIVTQIITGIEPFGTEMWRDPHSITLKTLVVDWTAIRKVWL